MIRQTEGDGQRTSRQKEGEIDKYETEDSNGSWREEDGVRLQMSARCFFFSSVFIGITASFHYTNHIRAKQLPLPCLFCMHDDLFVNEEQGNESTNLENMMMKMVENDYADVFFCKTLLAPLCNHDYLYRLV